jgi:type VI protein secretion system component VasK
LTETTWLELLALFLTYTASVISAVAWVTGHLNDKISLGEYNRRHKDLEDVTSQRFDRQDKRLRELERWQDLHNGTGPSSRSTIAALTERVSNPS